MPPRNYASARTDWGRLGVEAAQAGQLDMARSCLEKAIARQKRHAGHRYNLAIVLEQLGEIDRAAALLTEAVRLKPAMREAIARLGVLLRTYRLAEPGALDPFGLGIALTSDAVDRQIIAETAIRYLSVTNPLAETMAMGRGAGWDEAADALLVRRTGAALRNDLFHSALDAAINRDPDMERLLVALRRAILLRLDPERFADKALLGFAVALVAQSWNNEHVWPVERAEQAALSALILDPGKLASGDDEACRVLLRLALYRPLPDILDVDADPQAFDRVRPKGLRDLVRERMAEEREEREMAEALATLCPICDETSRVVARQYETSPYPRWTSLVRPRPGTLARALGRLFSAEALAFMVGDAPFDVLVAGAGTGYHAVLSATGYGARARVLGIDLSRRSLAHAVRMSGRLGVGNVTFMQADILDLERLDRTFDIIESIGVLHHMAEPLEGWRALVRRLRPGGLMLVGLYSAIARRGLAALRDEPDWPGPGCSDDEARAYRARLMARNAGRPGADLPGADLIESADFYALGDFRDLVLHPSERHFTLPEIEAFLANAGLVYRGLALPPAIFTRFEALFPDDPWPGRLANWWALEQEEPRLFEGMYQLWCEKAA